MYDSFIVTDFSSINICLFVCFDEAYKHSSILWSISAEINAHCTLWLNLLQLNPAHCEISRDDTLLLYIRDFWSDSSTPYYVALWYLMVSGVLFLFSEQNTVLSTGFKSKPLLNGLPWYTVKVMFWYLNIIVECSGVFIDFTPFGITLLIRFIVPTMLVFLAFNCSDKFRKVKKLLVVIFWPLTANGSMRVRTTCPGINPFMPTVPTFAVRETDVSQTANVGTVGMNGLSIVVRRQCNYAQQRRWEQIYSYE